MASIILDFDNVQVAHLDNQTWSKFSFLFYYGGTDSVPIFAQSEDKRDSGEYGAIDVSFRGTSIAFFGITPFENCSQYVLVSIDGGQVSNASFQDPLPPSEQQWYQTPLLEDTLHTVTLTRIPAIGFDFVVITAGQNTPLNNQILIVDDGDPSISYSGIWSLNDARWVRNYGDPNLGIAGHSYGNATHDTSTPGSSATVIFSGSSISLYGTIDYYNIGNVTVKYTLNGFSTTTTYSSTLDLWKTSDVVYGNSILFSDDSISPGNHTLEIEIIDCFNETFSLDYFTYKPSFDTLAKKPQITGTGSSTITATSTPNGTSVTTGHVQTGAIIGGVIGGTVVLVLVLLLLFRKKISISKYLPKKAPSVTTERGSTPEPFEVPYVYAPLRKQPPDLGDGSFASGHTSSPMTPYTGAMMQERDPSNSVYSSRTSPPPYHGF